MDIVEVGGHFLNPFEVNSVTVIKHRMRSSYYLSINMNKNKTIEIENLDYDQATQPQGKTTEEILIALKNSDSYQYGYDEGHSTGFTEGQNHGHDRGYSEGRNDGYRNGHENGREEGYSAGMLSVDEGQNSKEELLKELDILSAHLDDRIAILENDKEVESKKTSDSIEFSLDELITIKNIIHHRVSKIIG
jgi:hypothetical protein